MRPVTRPESRDAIITMPVSGRSARPVIIGEAVRQARTCYNHLAGKLGVEITQALLAKQFLVTLEDGYMLSPDGERWFYDFGTTDTLMRKDRPLFVPHHIDWSERRYHLAGILGAAFTKRLFEINWIKHIPGSRAVQMTEIGQRQLLKEIALDWQSTSTNR